MDIEVRGLMVCIDIGTELNESSVQIYFTGWGNPVLPRDFSELKDFFANFNENEKIPAWLTNLVDMLLESKDKAEKWSGVYREPGLTTKLPTPLTS